MAYDGILVFDVQFNTSAFEKGAQEFETRLQQLGQAAQDAAQKMSQLPEKTDKTTQSMSRLTTMLGKGAGKLLSLGIEMLVDSLDEAAGRYDAMSRFPVLMEQLGYSSEQSAAALQRLSEGTKGLPTSLDSLISATAGIADVSGSLDRSAQAALALNNAFLAGGASTEAAASGMQQYVQMLQNGTVDAQSWQALQEAMGPSLDRVAQAFGFAGDSATTGLFHALQTGAITLDQFQGQLIALNGGVNGFQVQAQNASGGIRSAWTSLTDAMVSGSATILASIDRGLSKTMFVSIENVVRQTGEGIAAAMEMVAPAIEFAAAHVVELTAALGLLEGAYGAYKAVQAFTAAQNAAVAAAIAAHEAGLILIPTLGAHTLAETKATGAISLKNFALVAMNNKMGLATVATSLCTAATTAFGAALKFATGPVGLITMALAAVAAIGVVVYNKVTAETEAFQTQEKAVNDLAEAQKSLAESEQSSASAAQQAVQTARSEETTYAALADQLDKLHKGEAQSATDKLQMAALVDQLNTKYQDLGLTYDEQTNQLSMTTEQLKDYIEAQSTLEQAAALQQRYNELLTEELTLREDKAALDSQQESLTQQLEEGLITAGEYNELMEQLNATRSGYMTQEEEIAARKGELDQQMAELDTAAAQTYLNNMAARQEAEAQELQRREEALESYTQVATDMFNRIGTESAVSVDEMISNLQYNQDTLSTWADNLVALGERGLDQGLLQELRDAGPESAATVAALVQASDEQLQMLSETFRNGGAVAVEALRTELGLPEATNAGSELVDNVAAGVTANANLTTATVTMIDNAVTAARDQVAASDFPSVGRQMMEGIAAGVRDGTVQVENAVRDAVRSSVDAGRDAAQIRSPSRVFRNAIGLNIMRGWALGVEDGQPLVVERVADAMNALRREVAGGLNPSALIGSMRSSVRTLQSGMAQRVTGYWETAFGGARPAGASVVNHTQNVYFEQPMQAPDEIARALRIRETYGLAGER